MALHGPRGSGASPARQSTGIPLEGAEGQSKAKASETAFGLCERDTGLAGLPQAEAAASSAPATSARSCTQGSAPQPRGLGQRAAQEAQHPRGLPCPACLTPLPHLSPPSPEPSAKVAYQNNVCNQQHCQQACPGHQCHVHPRGWLRVHVLQLQLLGKQTRGAHIPFRMAGRVKGSDQDQQQIRLQQPGDALAGHGALCEELPPPHRLWTSLLTGVCQARQQLGTVASHRAVPRGCDVTEPQNVLASKRRVRSSPTCDPCPPWQADWSLECYSHASLEHLPQQ
ncbi:hypothetical protein DUI87_08629 [Hirundo rustica rustica]|uniref:Uncharacterized protein n=1 Tax=Hirundo rustica rustica TaxID=333673 RepID=A0A3M0KKE0_HIRRU|nr:hypothetical protein DUI87_08629 [Hirundo rustica rustica]